MGGEPSRGHVRVGAYSEGMGPVALTLSPSRASDFQQCPLQYRLRAIDRLPEPPSAAATRGTLVHGVLEDLFDRPAHERTLKTARDHVPTVWQRMVDRDAAVVDLLSADGITLDAWLETAHALVGAYFRLEDPRRLEPAHREHLVQFDHAAGVTLKGFIDRLDIAPDGRMRVVDYKTGRSPKPGYESGALFQMRFYAYMLWRLHGQIPARLQILYLGNEETLIHDPTEAELLATERKIVAIWSAITSAVQQGHFPPKRSALCGWCNFQSLCPEFGGTPPAMPEISLPVIPKQVT